MSLAINFGGLNLNVEPDGTYVVDNSMVDWGTQGVSDALNSGDLRLEEYDQYAAETRLVRTVVLPLQVRSASQDALVTDQQALSAKLAAASRYAPVTLTVTPNGSSRVSTFFVYGGSWRADTDWLATHQALARGVLTLVCAWPVYGAAQNLGSSGAPLISNTASPAAVTLAPSPAGDVPADVTLFVKNRSASAIRSLFVSGIGGNTTWVASVPQTSWTIDGTGGVRSGGMLNSVATNQYVVQPVAHFTAPTLPSDRPFKAYLRCGQNLLDGGLKFRFRVVSGSVEVVGSWRALPVEYTSSSSPFSAALADMGTFYFPVGAVGALGGQSTTVYLETTQTMPLVFGNVIGSFEALFVPASGGLLVETSDTSKTLAAASGIVRIESDTAYDNSGNPIGGAQIGSHIRTTGGRYYVYASQGYAGSLDLTLPYAPENVDVWATVTPRYIGLAA